MVSHTFIRREIEALEANGHQISRFSIRPCRAILVDEADKAEQVCTRALLGVGIVGLLLALLQTVVTRPRRFGQALALAMRLGRRSERGLLVHLAYLAEACVLRPWLAMAEVRHLHAHFATNPATVAMLCRLLGGPSYSFTVHGIDGTDMAPSLGLEEKIRHATFVVAVSDYGRSQLYRWSDHADWSTIRLIRCGVDVNFLRSSPVPVPDVPRLVCVGRLSREKGQFLLIEAAGRLRDQGIDCELVLVGDGPLRGELESLIERLDLAGQVRLTGSLDGEGVRREILEARALVLPSFAEGLPVVLMEALALGRPVISTYVAGIPELVRPGINGWLVPAGSVEALVEALTEALTADVAELEQMGQAGALAVAERHDARIEAGKLSRLIAQDNLGVANGHQDPSTTLADSVITG